MWQLLPDDCKAMDVWQAFAEDADTKYFFLEGAVRSSKTFGSIIAWADYVANLAPPGPIIMMGNTYTTLKQNVLYPLIELVGPRNAKLKSASTELELFGRTIYLFGAPNIQAMFKLQGKGAVAAYCDEANTYPFDVWQMLGTRTAAEGIKIIGTFNPGSPRSWMKVEYLDRLEAVNGRSWHFVLDDNPFLSEKVKNELKSQYTGLWRKRYIEGLWVAAEGAIYDLAEDNICIDDAPAVCDKYHVAIDYGITNPTHFLLFGRANNIWYILKEWRWDSAVKQRQKTDLELSHDLGKFLEWRGQKIIPETVDIDPSATSFIVQTRQDYPELDIRYAINPVLEGIRTTSSALAKGDLKINRDECPLLLEEMAGYVWDPKQQEKGEDVPLKLNDHAMDPMRYGAMRIFRYS